LFTIKDAKKGQKLPSICGFLRKSGCKDLWLAAYLRTQNIPLIAIDRMGAHSIFYFEESERLHECVEQYVQDKAVVNLKSFRASLYDLKRLSAGDIPLPQEKGGIRE
jgi:hypothetical protein